MGIALGREQCCGGLSAGYAGLQRELQLAKATAGDEGQNRGLPSSLIRNSTWGFLRQQRRNSHQGLWGWAEGPKPLRSSPFIYSLRRGLLSSGERGLWCSVASTAGCFIGQLRGRAAPTRLDAKKRLVLTGTDRLSNQWWTARPKEFVKSTQCELLQGPSHDSWLGDRKTFRVIPNRHEWLWLWSDGESG